MKIIFISFTLNSTQILLILLLHETQYELINIHFFKNVQRPIYCQSGLLLPGAVADEQRRGGRRRAELEALLHLEDKEGVCPALWEIEALAKMFLLLPPSFSSLFYTSGEIWQDLVLNKTYSAQT